MDVRRSAVAAVSAAVLGLSAAPAIAAPNQAAGAAGVVAAVVQVDRTLNNVSVLSNIGEIKVVEVSDSLNNVLNRSPILSNNVVTIQDFLNNCTVASCIEITDFLNDNNVAISDVVAVDVLSGGDITVYVQ